MTVTEQALTFACAGETLIGILSSVESSPPLGVLVVVGGPQYRVGSHRQFVLLARHLAEHGIPVLRFDYRGMGDSSGAKQTFESIAPDVAAAVDAFVCACPSLERVVLWGLCDAASAGLLYCHATRDARVAGLVLLNPWVRSEQSLARTHVKHYYGQRLLQRAFWRKLIGGKLNIGAALRSLAGTVAAARASRTRASADSEERFQDRMAAALASFRGPVLLVLSGRDLTAKEFRDYARSNERWGGVVERDNVELRDFTEADHTFSTAATRQSVEDLTLEWLARSFRAQRK